MLEDALFRINGPVALRYPRGGEGEYKLSPRAAEHIVRPGKDLTMVAYGTMINEALSAAERLSASGISAEVIKLGSAAPADFSLTLESLRKTGRLLVARQIMAAAVSEEIKIKAAKLLNLGRGIVAHGGRDRLMEDHGIDACSIARTAGELCGR